MQPTYFESGGYFWSFCVPGVSGFVSSSLCSNCSFVISTSAMPISLCQIVRVEVNDTAKGRGVCEETGDTKYVNVGCGVYHDGGTLS